MNPQEYADQLIEKYKLLMFPEEAINKMVPDLVRLKTIKCALIDVENTIEALLNTRAGHDHIFYTEVKQILNDRL